MQQIPQKESLTPLGALEAAVLPALRRPPCLVSFSGGLDSSVVLGAAVRAARGAGLPLPVPITLRYPDAPETEEAAWQELVVRHLNLGEWQVRQVTDEHDLLGPTSTGVLRRHGVLFPANVFANRPVLEAADQGSVLTGFGGDEISATWSWRVLADALARRRKPVPRDVLRLAYAAAPQAIRTSVAARWLPPPWLPSWVHPDVRRAVAVLHSRERAAEPVRWSRWVEWQAGRPEIAATAWSMDVLAADAGTKVFHPLLDPRYLAALACRGGRFGFGSRLSLMKTLFADVIPAKLLTRSRKAVFGQVFWRSGSREFARSWDGSGVDKNLVDVETLREEWLKPSPHFGSAMLLQSAWLYRNGSGP